MPVVCPCSDPQPRPAREARATAVPVGGHDDIGSPQDLERAVTERRNDARRAWRHRGLSPEQTREIAGIRTDASLRIRDVVHRR